MKRQNTYRTVRIRTAWIAACAIAWAAAGCSQSDDVPETPAARVPLTVASAGLQTGVTVTKAATPLGAGQTIGLFLTNAPGVSAYTPANNVRYDNGDTGWSSPTPLGLDAEDAQVCAYYPYSATVTNSKQVLLTPHVLAADEAPLAYAPNQTVNSGKATINFTLKQAYAWLALTFEQGDRADCTLKELTLANSGLNKEYRLDITTGNKTASTPATDGKVTLAGELSLPRNGTVTGQLLLPPADALPGGVKVSVKVGAFSDDVMSTTLTGLTALTAGYKYAVTLTVSGTGLTATGVTASDWSETTVNNGGTGFIPES